MIIMSKYQRNYIFKNSCEIRLYQVGIIDIMKGCIYISLMLLSWLLLFYLSNVTMVIC